MICGWFVLLSDARRRWVLCFAALDFCGRDDLSEVFYKSPPDFYFGFWASAPPLAVLINPSRAKWFCLATEDLSADKAGSCVSAVLPYIFQRSGAMDANTKICTLFCSKSGAEKGSFKRYRFFLFREILFVSFWRGRKIEFRFPNHYFAWKNYESKNERKNMKMASTNRKKILFSHFNLHNDIKWHIFAALNGRKSRYITDTDGKSLKS